MVRPKEPPTADEVYDAMVPNECYVAAGLRIHFEDEYGVSHNTIRNRLSELVEDDRVEKKEHPNGAVTYRRVE